jgi:hypothetical protein
MTLRHHRLANERALDEKLKAASMYCGSTCAINRREGDNNGGAVQAAVRIDTKGQAKNNAAVVDTLATIDEKSLSEDDKFKRSRYILLEHIRRPKDETSLVGRKFGRAPDWLGAFEHSVLMR